MSYWGLHIVFRDSGRDRFVELGGAAWLTKRERDRAFSKIPAATSDSPFIVDVVDDDDIVRDRLITKATAEYLLGKRVSV